MDGIRRSSGASYHQRQLEITSAYHSVLRGYGSGAGEASETVKEGVRHLILNEAQYLPFHDQAILLAIADVESGFNPDATSPLSSAAGVFQIVRDTAKGVGLEHPYEVYSAKSNISAGVRLYEDYLQWQKVRYPGAQGNRRVAILYGFHHDGPSLEFGGVDIGFQRVVPLIHFYERYVEEYWARHN